MACAWTISTPYGKAWVKKKGGGLIPDLHKDQISSRAELGRQLRITTFVKSIVIPQEECQMKTVYDELRALNKVGIYREYIKCSSDHVYMVSMMSEMAFISLSPTQEHVYGHQDAKNGVLSRLAKLNNKMDVM